MYQKYKLKQIANINSGYSFRTKIRNNPEGNTYAIQMRDISDGGLGIINEPLKVDVDKINMNHYLRKGDILFLAKGANNFAVCFDEKFKPAVATSAFFVIRLINESIIPEFICLYMNSSISQNYFQVNMAGTYIPNINLSTLKDMEFIIPPLSHQKKIVTVFQLHLKEKDLIVRLLQKREILVNEIVKRLING